MQVKGTGIKTTREFVKTNFPDKYNEWLDTLPAESKNIYSGAIDVGGWFDVKTAYYIPIDKIALLFYNNNTRKCGDELGRYSAEVALKGIYKVFLLVATPQYLMKKASNMMRAFYQPSEIEIAKSMQKRVQLKIKTFDNINNSTEYRIAGWCARALELCNCQNVSYQLLKQISKGQPETLIELKWS